MKKQKMKDKEKKMEDNIKKDIILKVLENDEYDPFSNITVKEVAKDLKVGENLANDIFKRDDFPSVNIGKTKTITILAYIFWKMERRV